ncbi:hypothetical protein AW25_1088 [Francisella tularensis subsp. novicida U112]|nr:hypothetical protein AW25_1088 [Francisella tularensis subsp. novicida U112]
MIPEAETCISKERTLAKIENKRLWSTPVLAIRIPGSGALVEGKQNAQEEGATYYGAPEGPS